MNARYSLGRSLQLVGLFLLPFGIASQLLEKMTLGQSMAVALVGAAVFYLGFLVQPRS